MSAISLKSISGITSITTPAGVDDQLTLHNNNSTEAVKLDIAGNLHFHNHLNITGVSTASNFKTGTSNLHNTGLNVQDLDVDGHANLDNVSIAGVTTITGSGNALEIVGGLVRSRNTASARFVANNGSAEGYFGWSSGVLTVGQATATLSLEATGSNHIQLKTNGNERVRITGDGKTIISYPSDVAQTPAAILDVFNQGTTTQALRVYRNDLNDNTLAAFQSYHNARGIVDKMVITSRGRVGINTNNPQREIHVKPWDNNPATAVPGYIRIEGQGSDQPGILELYHTRGNGSDKWPSSVASVDGGLTLNVANGNNGAPQEKLRIRSNGTVHTAMTGTVPTWLGSTIATREKFSIFQGANFGEACFNIDVDNANSFLSHNMYYDGGWKIRKSGSPVRHLEIGTNGWTFMTGADGSNDTVSALTNRFRIKPSGRVQILNNNEDIDMSSNADGQLQIDGNGYTGAISLNDEGMFLYHNSSTRYIGIGIQHAEVGRFSTGGYEQRFSNTSTYSSTTGSRKGIYVFNSGATTNCYASLELAANNSSGYFGSTILNSIATADTAYSNHFAIQLRHGGNYYERLRIASDGQVGINATNPQSMFEVLESSTGQTETQKRIAIFRKNGTAVGDEGYIHLTTMTGHYGVKLGFANEGASPGYLNQGFFISTVNSGENITNHTKKFVIKSDGRISAGKHGVGTHNDASEWFKVQSNDTAANISIVGSNDTHSSLNLGDEDDFNIQKIKSDHTNNSLQFFTNNQETLRIDGNNKVIVASGQVHSSRVLAKFGIDCHGMNIYDNVGVVANYGLAFYNDPNTNYANGIGFFNDDGQTCGGYIVHQDKGGSNIGDIVMATSATANNPVQRLRLHYQGGIQINSTVNVSPFVPNMSGSGLDGGLVLTTPAYSEYHFTWSGQSSATIDVTCGSYFHSEFTYVQHQTNGGVQMHSYARGKWANNHTTHTGFMYEFSGGGSGLNTSFTVSDQSGGGSVDLKSGLSTAGAPGAAYLASYHGGNENTSTTANGRLRINEVYQGSGLSVGTRALIIRVYFGSFAISKS